MSRQRQWERLETMLEPSRVTRCRILVDEPEDGAGADEVERNEWRGLENDKCRCEVYGQVS